MWFYRLLCAGHVLVGHSDFLKTLVVAWQPHGDRKSLLFLSELNKLDIACHLVS